MEQSHQRPDVPTCSSKDEFPLSFAQERLWFLDQLEPGNPVYNLASAYRISGQLDVATLERSLNEIGRRHETLRMIFPSAGGKPNLIIRESLPLALKVVDLRALRHSPQEAAIQHLVTDETKNPFDLSHGPLVRACLFQLSENEYVFLVVTHKIISDEASFGIFFQELLLIYAAFTDGKCSPLPELPRRYTEYSMWQRGRLEGGYLERQLGYWKQQLAGCPPSLQLATDSPRPSKRTYRGATYRTSLSHSLSTALRDFSQQHQVSLYVLFLAAFGVLLHRYTEQDDIVVGGTLQGRNRAEFKPLIGCFEQSLALRTDLSGDPDFRELLSRVIQITSEGFSNQDLPFEELLKELQVDRDLSHEPLFQVRFQLRVVNKIAVIPPGLTLETFEFDTGVSQYDLALEVKEQSLGFRYHFQYNRDLFEAASIARMAGHFETLLGSIAAHQEGKISLLPLLTDGERRQLLQEWNEIKVADQKTAFSHELFEAQVARTPESVAVTFQGESLSYRALDQHANQLAHYLQNFGIRPEVPVGICMERSIELVVAVLAVLKAGGACLPLDSALPKSRLTLMVEAAHSPVILTQTRFLDKVSTLTVRIVAVDAIQEALAQHKKEAPVSGLIEQNLAFVFFTSGSTGDPKAVMRNHHKQSEQNLWVRSVFQLTVNDRHLMKTAIGFSPLATEIFQALNTGGRLIIAPPGVEQDSTALVRFMAQHQITVTNFVPSMLRVILEEPELENCTTLSQVMCFGEILPVELEERFFARLSADLSIVYGVTEAPGATFRKGKCGQCQPVVNIGRRYSSKHFYILNSQRQLAPIGIPGEIYIGGDDLARGYLNRPDLTAEKFIPNPFSVTRGARIYQAGDRARYLADGSLEFFGRMDHQMKIRGFRVEPGEIEVALEKHPTVQQAVAMLLEERPGEMRLVAYVVPKQGQTSTRGDLRGFLKQKLPDYMIPSTFVILDKLPLTPAGKVNRKALPAPDWGRTDLEGFYVPPRTPVEEQLTKIWGEVLGVERVGVHDNFFELGGHSLLATQVMSRVRKAFQAEIPLRVLFEVLTVEGLAVAVVEALTEKLDPAEITHLFP
jgi:amino acid adenylation domain-containing protein